MHLHTYSGVLVPAGVHKSEDGWTAGLRDAQTGRAGFCATISLETFYVFSRIIPFENQEMRAVRRERAGSWWDDVRRRP